jgi:DNA-binding CsgD family transcriptional regulator
LPEISTAARLIERDRELSLFDDLVRPDGAGGCGLVVIEGMAGIGKSRLIAELRDRAIETGVLVLAANGSDLEREFPFGVVRQLFDPVLTAPGTPAGVFEGAAAPAGPVFGTVPEGDGSAGDVSFAALHGLYWLTLNVAGDGRLMVIVDDLHWCDRPSLRFLAYLARRLDGLAATLVVGLRTAEPGTDPVMLGEIVSSPGAMHLSPWPLTLAGVAELIARRLDAEPDSAFAEACLSATGGNPLLVCQLLSSLAADGVVPRAAHADAVKRVGPRAVSRTVLLRLRRLPETAAAVAQAVAVLNNNADLPLVASLTGLDEADVAAATAALARAEILRPEPPLGFVHPLVRDAVYHELPPGERELCHARAAHLLAETTLPAEAVATQLLAAPRRGERWVVDRLREAAGAARAKGAADSAVAYLQRALQEPPPPDLATDVLLELGLAETFTSGQAAATHLREAWDRLTEPRPRAVTAAVLARTLLFTAPAQEAVEVAEQALAETPVDLVDERQALRACGLIALFFGAGDTQVMNRLDGIVLAGEGPGAKMLASSTAFGRLVTGASMDECVALAREALAGGVLIEADPGLFPVGPILTLLFADLDEAMVAWDELRELAYRRGALLGILTVGLWRGFSMMWRGELREAQELFEVARDDFRAWGLLSPAEVYLPAFIGAVRLARGDLAGAREQLFGHHVPDARTDGHRHLLWSRAELLLAEGRFAEALELAEDLSGRMTFITHPAWAPWRSLKARALDGLGRTGEAIAVAEDNLEHARRFGSPGVVGMGLSLLGRLHRENGVALLREAVAHLERSTVRLELAAGLLALGGALRRSRRPTEAREPLRRALELADRCGADGLAAEVRAEIYATGARPRTTALQGAESLTASERRVADLAADGRSNKEIAQTLYVTPKTVEVHLSSAYRKLSIRSRQQLAVALSA